MGKKPLLLQVSSSRFHHTLIHIKLPKSKSFLSVMSNCLKGDQNLFEFANNLIN